MRKNRVVFFAMISMAVLLAAYFSFDRIAIQIFARSNDLDICYRALKKLALNEFVFTDLGIIEKKNGFGLASAKARIKIVWKSLNPQDMELDVDLDNVNFIKHAKEKEVSYDSLDALIALPFSSNWTYRKIAGRIYPSRDGLGIKDFTAESGEIKLSFTGKLYNNNRISSDITIYLADELTKKIPPELSGTILRGEEGGWKSLSVKLEGDYASPSIQVSGRLFRLNIGVKE